MNVNRSTAFLIYIVIFVFSLSFISCRNENTFQEAHLNFVSSSIKRSRMHSQQVKGDLDSLLRYWNEAVENHEDIDLHSEILRRYFDSIYLHGMIYCNEINLINSTLIEEDHIPHYSVIFQSSNEIILALQDFKQNSPGNSFWIDQEMTAFLALFIEKTNSIDSEIQSYLEEH